MRAIVAGMIATFPVGGVAWDYGQYALGLERLGFDVYYLEDTGLSAYDARTREYNEDPSYGVAFLQRALALLSPTLAHRWHFRAANGQTYGMERTAFEALVAKADLFLNVSGACLLRDAYMPCLHKVLIDTDPGWNHFVVFPRWDAHPGWQDTHGYRAHDHFFTYAARLGATDCPLPDLGLSWHPTRPPVVLECWPLQFAGQRWTTVMTWDNYGQPLTYQGVTYGSKADEFRALEDLPRRAGISLEIAAGGVHPPCEHWRQLGWSVVDGPTVSRTPERYRDYILHSRGECSVAKNVYAATKSGWFSCRTACYLAAGKPAVVQDTGFSEVIPTGRGLVAFATPDEALAGLAAVEAEYAVHQKAAREVAYRYLEARIVLSELLSKIGLEVPYAHR
jgi:hypothetical protein